MTDAQFRAHGPEGISEDNHTPGKGCLPKCVLQIYVI